MNVNKTFIGYALGMAVAITAFVLLQTGAATELNNDTFNTNAINPPEKAGNPKMDQTLYYLAKSKNPNAFAEEKGIEMIGDKVRVIIILINDGNLPIDKNIIIEERDKNLVQALVPVSSLFALADEPDVQFIKPPEKYRTMETPKQAGFPSVFSWVAVLVMFSLIKIRRRT